MFHSQKTTAGFTLVELAISLMVIGLLLGGILKGQELITSARLTSAIKQFKEFETATQSFQTIYGALPGDIRNPTRFIKNCSTTPCNTAGDGNGYIAGATGTTWVCCALSNVNNAANAAGEARRYWIHLVKAGLIPGVVDVDSNSATLTQLGVELPTSPVTNAGWSVATYTSNGSGIGGGLAMTNTMSLRVASSTGSVLTGLQAKFIDEKIDNGNPASGLVWALNQSDVGGNAMDAGCVTSGNYVVDGGTKACNLLFLMSTN